jgi:heat shock protein 4
LFCRADHQRGFQPGNPVSLTSCSAPTCQSKTRWLTLTLDRSLVGFGPKSRYLGEPAKTQEISNLKNTVSCLKRLIGRAFNDPDTQIEQKYISAPLVDINGQVGAEVSYLGQKEQFTATQLVAMFLSKIKQTTAAELKLPVSEMVMSVPAWFTDVQRRALLDAAEIVGLKVLRLINDTTAAALGYGITKLDLPAADEKPRRVAFVDVGYSDYSCAIVEFKKGELAVKGNAYDRHFGGRNFDKALVEHLQKEFHGKYKIDIFSNPTATTRFYSAAEKVKKILSANQQAPLNIESLMNDIDVRAMITRQEFEAMVEPLFASVDATLEQALTEAKLTKEDIDIVEVVGGGSRVPAIKERIQAFFGKTLSFTLNQDEAIARGCAFSCAILSPVFKVRDFAVQDVISYPIEFAWEKDADIPDEDTSLTVFNKGNVMPSTKILTFYRKQAFDLEARYAAGAVLPGKVSPFIGRFSVKGVKATGTPEDFMICKLKARVNIHGVLNVESGYYVEDQEVEEEIKDENGDVSTFNELEKNPQSVDSEQMDAGESTEQPLRDPKRRKIGAPTLSGPKGQTDENKPRNELTNISLSKAMDTDAKEDKPKTRKVKKQVRKGELPIVSATQSLDTTAKNAVTEREAAMVMEDKLVADTEEKKNELETYIYDMRNKLDDQYAEFASDEEKAKIREKLEATEVSLSDSYPSMALWNQG